MPTFYFPKWHNWFHAFISTFFYFLLLNENASFLLLWCMQVAHYICCFYPHKVWDEDCSGSLFLFLALGAWWKKMLWLLWEVHSVFPVTLSHCHWVTECIPSKGELKVVCLWNWPKQELREKNWSAMEALSATESMLQGKLSKTVKVRHPTSVYFSSSNLNWPGDISFSAITHHKAAYSFTSLSHFFLFGHKVLNWL